MLPIIMADGSKRIIPESDKMDLAVSVLENFFTCNIENQSCSALSDNLMFHHTEMLTHFRRCFLGKGPMFPICPEKRCIEMLYKHCIERRVVVMKTIRLPMTLMERLLNRFPNLRVIHLVRDPRATLNSEIMAGHGQWKSIDSISMEFCDRVHEDIISAIELSKKFKNRILRIRYEDLIFNPFSTTRRMYNFGRLNYTGRTEDFLRLNIYGESDDDEFLTDKYEKTGPERSRRWRSFVTFSNAEIIDHNCAAVYKHLGYKTVQNEETYNNISNNLFKSI
ncbi:hypothetical protein ScPMuIL_011424 [Solemya velum]